MHRGDGELRQSGSHGEVNHFWNRFFKMLAPGGGPGRGRPQSERQQRRRSALYKGNPGTKVPRRIRIARNRRRNIAVKASRRRNRGH